MSDKRKISELIPDHANANKGTERGRYALEASLRQYGAGRSILLDKNGRIIAGNKTVEVAADVGLDDVLIVQTDGTADCRRATHRPGHRLSVEGRGLAYADNRVGELSLEWDAEQVLADLNAGMDLSALWKQDELNEMMQGIDGLSGVLSPDDFSEYGEDIETEYCCPKCGYKWSGKGGMKPPYRVPSMEEIKALPWNGYNAISTFSGCGGSSLGYKMAGFRVLWASEFIPAAQDTYRANHAGTILDTRDIRIVQAQEILDAIQIQPGELDLFDGSPPCASFSTAGKREAGWGKVKNYSDTKQRTDDLFFEYTRLLAGVQPKVFVAENVSGLVKGTAKGYFLEILAALKECGYVVSAKLLDAQWLGVPQMRQHNKYINLKRAGLNTPSQSVTAIGGQNPGIASVTHPTEKRKFSIAELRRICAFPDDFILTGTYAQQWERLGRAVPPVMMMYIAKTIQTEVLDKCKA
jgi:site-specific DNA-cytosine methylase